MSACIHPHSHFFHISYIRPPLRFPVQCCIVLSNGHRPYFRWFKPSKWGSFGLMSCLLAFLLLGFVDWSCSFFFFLHHTPFFQCLCSCTSCSIIHLCSAHLCRLLFSCYPSQGLSKDFQFFPCLYTIVLAGPSVPVFLLHTLLVLLVFLFFPVFLSLLQVLSYLLPRWQSLYLISFDWLSQFFSLPSCGFDLWDLCLWE